MRLKSLSTLIFLALLWSHLAYGGQCIAHRALSEGVELENTVAAVTAAQKSGVSRIELDLRFTKDGVAVIHHDAEVNGVFIGETDYIELVERELRVDKLQTLFELATPIKLVLLDIKDNDIEIDDLRAALPATYFCQTIAFQSESLGLLRKIGSAWPSCERYWVAKLKRRYWFGSFPSAASLVSRLKAQDLDGIVAKGRRFVDKEYVGQFQNSGLKYLVWTINKTARIKRYEEIGVDAIITDAPLACMDVTGEDYSKK
ncbi:MAG: glycerophosphodiester phosphodiesterase [Pseudomonadota bacterium]